MLKRFMSIILAIAMSIIGGTKVSAHAISVRGIEGEYDIRITASPINYKYGIIFAGKNADAQPTDHTVKAMLWQIDENGNIVWSYECGDDGTKNTISKLYINQDGNLLAYLTVVDQSMSIEQYILTFEEGKLMDVENLPKESYLISFVDDGMLLREHHGSSVTDNVGIQDEWSLTYYDAQFNRSWAYRLEGNITFAGATELSDRYVAYGSFENQDGTFYQYIICIDNGGNCIWSDKRQHESGQYLSATEGARGDVVVVGGQYKAQNNPEFTVSDIACYSSNGVLKWEKSEIVGERGYLYKDIIHIPEGYVVVGANALMRQTVNLTYYDLEGDIIDRWDETLNQGFCYVDYLRLLEHDDVVYVAVASEFNSDSVGIPERFVYRTQIKEVYE